MTPDGISQMSPHGPIPVFTYPSHPAPSYEHISPQLSTVITSSTVSPVVTIQHTPAWGSPSDTISPFVDTTVDFSSPIVSYNFSFFPIKWLCCLTTDYWSPPTEFRVLRLQSSHNYNHDSLSILRAGAYQVQLLLVHRVYYSINHTGPHKL